MATGRPEARSALQILFVGHDVIRPVLHRHHRGDLAQLGESVRAIPDAGGGGVLEDDERQVHPIREDLVVAQDHIGLHLRAPHEQGRREDQKPCRAGGPRIPRQVDRLERAVRVDPGDQRDHACHLIRCDGERPLALLARERRDLGCVAIDHDARDALRLGEPAQMPAVGGLVDLEVGGEGEQVRRDAAAKAHGRRHAVHATTSRARWARCPTAQRAARAEDRRRTGLGSRRRATTRACGLPESTGKMSFTRLSYSSTVFQ